MSSMSMVVAARAALAALVALATQAALAIPLGAQAGRAASQDARVTAAVERFAPAAIGMRQRFHQHPELGNREVKTAEAVAAHLRALGMEVRTNVAHTGVIGVLRGGRPGPVVAVRADMDALPVTEDTPYPFRSTVRATYLGQEVGVAHACGHDIHTAVQLGVASVLASMKERVPGTVLFVFQPAEEGPPPGERGGAKLMLEEGAFAGPTPSAVFGLHVFAEMELGKVGYTPGPAMASASSFVATLEGKQAHGAYPHLGIDPVVMAAQAVLALQTIRSRTLDPLEPGVVTVGMIRGGERSNIIPAKVELQGTIRTFDMETRALIDRRMHEILDGVARAAGGSYTLAIDHAYPVTVNDTTLAGASRPTLQRVMGAGNVVLLPPTPGAEDFSYFANTVPGFFYRLGGRKPGTTSGGHHTPTFNMDDGSVPVGMRTMASLLLDYLERGSAVSSR
jgi:amidohydrolase